MKDDPRKRVRRLPNGAEGRGRGREGPEDRNPRPKKSPQKNKMAARDYYLYKNTYIRGSRMAKILDK